MLLTACSTDRPLFVPAPEGDELHFIVFDEDSGLSIEGPFFGDRPAVRLERSLSSEGQAFLVTLGAALLSSLGQSAESAASRLRLVPESETCAMGRRDGNTLRLPLPPTFVARRITSDGLVLADERERAQLGTFSLLVPVDDSSCRPPFGPFRPFGDRALLLSGFAGSATGESLTQLHLVTADRLLAMTVNYLYLFERGAPARTDSTHRLREGGVPRGRNTGLSVLNSTAPRPSILLTAAAQEDDVGPKGSVVRVELDEAGLRFVKTETVTADGIVGAALDPSSNAVVAVAESGGVYTTTAVGGRYVQAGQIPGRLRLRSLHVTGVAGGLSGLLFASSNDAVVLATVDSSAVLHHQVEVIGDLFHVRATAFDPTNGRIFVAGRDGRVAERQSTGVWTSLDYELVEALGGCGTRDECGRYRYQGFVPSAVHLKIRDVSYLVLVASACSRGLMTIRLSDGCPGVLELDAERELTSLHFSGDRLLVGGDNGLVLEAVVEPE